MVLLNDVKKAHEKIQNRIHVTPIITSSQLNKHCEREVFLKAEHLQKTGSFKIRGATNAVMQAVAAGASFVTAASSGNHGQAVAYIAGQLGVSAVIVVPEDASRAKIEAIKDYGAEIEYCGLTSDERIPRAKQRAKERNGVYIPPYDDPAVIAGQGTIALEILEQLPNVDVIVVPVGGGGLMSGILCAVKNSKPEVHVVGVEPESANDTYLSLQNRRITAISGTSTLADGLRTTQPGDVTFPILQEHLDELVLVTEEEIKKAFQFLLERTKQLVEPSGATALAAVMVGKVGKPNEKIAVVLSGGNVDLYQISTLLKNDMFNDELSGKKGSKEV
ncbi:pyridoxal-5'-phosphate-dependent protein beta subunit [Planococcus donghaensis MPA1U2]|uniref:threonine ammonia-lyase n=1 Tax=Planococcus donghaensis MPA1U2 TaxID=933115 RepID=E7RI59_9BACL|nr:threonine/serine dehydratase [Planococcus donghaensis]EGA89298.1 pyridoxal-5'-phosphate-dependent protein beta subunit [Planococcus donghaensis MPA1U2]